MTFEFDEKTDSFYGEWVPLTEEMSLEKAKIYLEMWREIFLQKHDLELLDERFIHKPDLKTFCLKICTRKRNTT